MVRRRGRGKGVRNHVSYLRDNKKGLRTGSTYFYRLGPIPLEEAFIKQHALLHDKTFEDSYGQVMQVMVTLQHMLLTNNRFMLPGIGVIGLSENAKRGISLSSSTLWWTPGLVNVIATAPGWENAPLNGYLTPELLTNINRLIAKLRSEDRKILSPKQFYDASDFNMEGYTSDQKLEYLDKANDEKRREARDNMVEIRKTRRKYLVEQLTDRITYLEGLIDVPIEPFDLEKVIND